MFQSSTSDETPVSVRSGVGELTRAAELSARAQEFGELTRAAEGLTSSASSPESSKPFTLPTYRQETIRHILLGDHAALVEAINHLAALGYCEHLAWSEPIPTGRHGEFISVMTRRRGVTTG